MRIYCIQCDIEWENKPANFRRVLALLENAPPEPDALVLLPEMFATGFSMDVARIAEPAGGETEQFLQQLARSYRVTVIGGVARMGPDGLGRNRALVIGTDGATIADYAKLHPFSFGEESRHYRGGEALLTFPWAGTHVLPSICYDLRFPELFRRGTRAGAEVITVIAQWPAAREHHWLTLLAARAIENQCYVAACNRIGHDPRNAYRGRSLILDPRGQILADADSRETVISAQLDMAALRQYRRDFPALADMRPDLLPE
jgi:omega-amidase